MPTTFQQISAIPDDHFVVVKKPTSSDSWVSAGSAGTIGEATSIAQGLVQPPTNNYQAMVLSPAIAFQKAS